MRRKGVVAKPIGFLHQGGAFGAKLRLGRSQNRPSL